MIKNFSKILLCMAVALTACSQRDDEPIGAVNGEEGSASSSESAKVTFGLSRTDAEDFINAGVTEMTIFVYKAERKGTSFVTSKTMPVGDGTLDMEFPLGNTYSTFAVANAKEITNSETLETVTVNLVPEEKNEVWISPVVKFASDKSVSSVSLNLVRRVAQISFAPAETDDEIAAISDFDGLNIHFLNVAKAIKVSGFKAEATELVIPVTKAQGFKTSFYSFDTSALADGGKLMLEYTKGGSVVNTSKELFCDGKYLASKRYNLQVPITDATFLATPWSRGDEQLFIDMQITDF